MADRDEAVHAVTEGLQNGTEKILPLSYDSHASAPIRKARENTAAKRQGMSPAFSLPRRMVGSSGFQHLENSGSGFRTRSKPNRPGGGEGGGVVGDGAGKVVFLRQQPVLGAVEMHRIAQQRHPAQQDLDQLYPAVFSAPAAGF